MRLLELGYDLGQQIGACQPRRYNRKRAGARIAELSGSTTGLHQQRLGPQNVVRDKFASARQGTVSASMFDQCQGQRALKIRNVLRNGRLADTQLRRGR